MTYLTTRTCKDCKHVDSFELTKVQAAFPSLDAKEIWNRPCSKCGSQNCLALSRGQPNIDQELLDIWGKDTALFFMEQDESIILAELDFFPIMLQAIDEEKYLKPKIDILIEAICVLLYDNIVAPEEYTVQENKAREKIVQEVKPELIKRRQKIAEAGEAIMDYIREVVYPEIGLNFE